MKKFLLLSVIILTCSCGKEINVEDFSLDKKVLSIEKQTSLITSKLKHDDGILELSLSLQEAVSLGIPESRFNQWSDAIKKINAKIEQNGGFDQAIFLSPDEVLTDENFVRSANIDYPPGYLVGTAPIIPPGSETTAVGVQHVSYKSEFTTPIHGPGYIFDCNVNTIWAPFYQWSVAWGNPHSIPITVYKSGYLAPSLHNYAIIGCTSGGTSKVYFNAGVSGLSSGSGGVVLIITMY